MHHQSDYAITLFSPCTVSLPASNGVNSHGSRGGGILQQQPHTKMLALETKLPFLEGIDALYFTYGTTM